MNFTYLWHNLFGEFENFRNFGFKHEIRRLNWFDKYFSCLNHQDILVINFYELNPIVAILQQFEYIDVYRTRMYNKLKLIIWLILADICELKSILFIIISLSWYNTIFIHIYTMCFLSRLNARFNMKVYPSDLSQC